MQNKTDNKEKCVHLGHRERMRRRVIENGLDSLNDHEILEFLLFYSIPRMDTNEIAHSLINHFGSLSAVFSANIDQLCCVKGISESSAVLINTVAPLCRRYKDDLAKKTKLRNSSDCGEFFIRYYAGLKVEQVEIVCLDASCKVLGHEAVCDGDAGGVMLNIRKLIEKIIKHPACTACIIAHNHPSGIALPSRDDIEATTELKKTLGAMGISLVDHIIVADNDYISMASSKVFKNIF